MTTTSTVGEHTDLQEVLTQSRAFLRHTIRGLTDEDAARRATASELTLSTIIKHVAATEASWLAFAMGEPRATEPRPEKYFDEFHLRDGETLADVLQRYEQVARATDEWLAGRPDLNVSYPLPEAPWFPPGARWSARQALLHIVAETAQHAGHADIIRESLDGAKGWADML